MVINVPYNMKKPLFGLLLLLLALTSCGNKKSAVPERPAFAADTAYQFISRQLRFGPRVPNSKSHTDCAVFLMQQLRAYGAEVELQKGSMLDYSGRPQAVFNIIGHFYTDNTRDRSRVLLCAHYDTRPWCDEEEEYENRFLNVPGANDGASGVGVLLEVARQLGKQVADSTLSTPVDIVFFDCEDMGTPQFYTGIERENTWCLGSQLWASEYAQNGNNVKYRFGILLDMVGAPDASFPREMYSTQYAESYVETVWRAAAALGHGRYFTNQQAYPIVDDHYYVNTLAGIPCVDIIHYGTRNATGFPSWWHTQQDDMRNISTATLQAVGETVLSVIQ